MTEIYRFRSIPQLLDEFHELERQNIYFAEPSELNDPMEGIRDVFWFGDSIVWTNLFRNYIASLYMTYHAGLIFGEEDQLPLHHVPYRGLPDSMRSAPIVDLIERAIIRVFNAHHLSEFIDRLAAAEVKVRQDELFAYLLTLHSAALYEIETDFIESGFIDPQKRSVLEKPGISELYQNPDFFGLAGSELKDRQREFLMRYLRQALAARHMITRYNFNLGNEAMQGENAELIFLNFPRTFVDRLVAQLYPKWYAASFASHCNNSSMWAHYADSHRGACLIFEPDFKDGKRGLMLAKQPVTDARRPGQGHFYEVREVTYQPKREELDYFRSIGWLPRPDLLKHWYSDADGNLSETGSHLGPQGDVNRWRERFWADYYRDIVVKSNDWAYEREKRIVIHSVLDDLVAKETRILSYDFSALKGVVFGIKTSETDKQRIIDVLREKCVAIERKEIGLHQAFYEPESGDIQTMPM